jgi:alpha-N-acetylgalactosaminidase
VSTGLAAAGFTGVHLDDCIMAPARDAVSHELVADPIRFPSGFEALGSFIHGLNLTFAMYTAESDTTCAGLPGSRGFEALDAATFARWGADYLKADGCGDPTYYSEGYAAMGSALQATGRDIVFSCSWPAYLGSDEAQKPFGAMIHDGCNLWRNFIDMGPTPGYVQGILEHFGNYSAVLSTWAGPGHWNDPDQLLVGSDAISDDLAWTQLALYAIIGAPLILGTDVRSLPPTHLSMLLNPAVMQISQVRQR